MNDDLSPTLRDYDDDWMRDLESRKNRLMNAMNVQILKSDMKTNI